MENRDFFSNTNSTINVERVACYVLRYATESKFACDSCSFFVHSGIREICEIRGFYIVLRGQPT